MDRTYPFDPLERCDECGCLGAFDFMGDCYCAKCLQEFGEDLEDEYDEWLEDEEEYEEDEH